MTEFDQIFCTSYLRPLFSPGLTAVRGPPLCISGFVDDVVFSPNGANGPEPKTMNIFRRVRQVALPEAKLLSTITG